LQWNKVVHFRALAGLPAAKQPQQQLSKKPTLQNAFYRIFAQISISVFHPTITNMCHSYQQRQSRSFLKHGLHIIKTAAMQ